MTAPLVEVCHFGNFFQLRGGVFAAVPVRCRVVTGMTMRPRVVQSMAVTQNLMRSCVMTTERAVVSMLTTGIVTDMTGNHAEDHVSKAQHGTYDIKCSECS